jgi:hypothetical protein
MASESRRPGAAAYRFRAVTPLSLATVWRNWQTRRLWEPLSLRRGFVGSNPTTVTPFLQ